MVTAEQAKTGSYLNLTTDNTAPQCASNAVDGGDGDVDVEVVFLESSATVRASVCQQRRKGVEVAATFVVRESSTVLLSFSLLVDSEKDVTDKMKSTIRGACARAMGISDMRIKIQSDVTSQRRLLAVTMAVRVLAQSTKQAASLLQMAVNGLEMEMMRSGIAVQKGSLVGRVQVCNIQEKFI